MHGAAQKACEPVETVAQNSVTETNRFSFLTWTVRLSLYFLFFFPFVLIAFLFFFPFFTYRTTEQGWVTERWLHDRCAHEVADG
jgi:hypothetical protein